MYKYGVQQLVVGGLLLVGTIGLIEFMIGYNLSTQFLPNLYIWLYGLIIVEIIDEPIVVLS